MWLFCRRSRCLACRIDGECMLKCFRESSLFPSFCWSESLLFSALSPDDTVSPEKLDHIRNQLSNILHALSSTFTACACGARAKNCAVTQMAAFVNGDMNIIHHPEKVDLGPLVGKRRGFRTKERVPYSGGPSCPCCLVKTGCCPK